MMWCLRSPTRSPLPKGWKLEEKLLDFGGGFIEGSNGWMLFGKVFHGANTRPTPGLLRRYPDELEKFTDDYAANKMFSRAYREGWKLPS